MFRTLLVPLDGSAFAEQALPLALGLARRAGAALRLVLVAPPLAMVYPEASLFVSSDIEEQDLARKRAYLDGVVKRLGAVSAVPVTATVLQGDVVPMLYQQATDGRADLVVMTTHGRGPLRRFWLGSVADELIRRLPMPLLLVRPREEKADLLADPVFKHILLPLDGSEFAEQSIEPAVALGSLTDADYTLLRVLSPLPTNIVAIDGVTFATTLEMMDEILEMQARARKTAQAYLETVADRLRARGFRVQTRVVDDEPPAPAILRDAALPGVDLVALETHARHGLPRLLLGSVADKVIRGGNVPVLVHRPLAR